MDSAIVLVVDDVKSNRDILARRLHREGHTVVTAEDGRQALELMRGQPFDLVLLDIMMPEMDGYQVLEHMRADATLRHVPVIVISAVDEVDSVVRCIKLGAEDYLSKPFNRVLLQARIGASLEKKYWRDREQAYVEELASLQRIDRELNASLDVHRAMSITLEWALRRSGSQAGLVGSVGEDGIQIMATEGYAAELTARWEDGSFSSSQPLVQRAIQSGQPQRVSGLDDGEGLLPGARSQVVIPICRESYVIGVLLLERVDPGGYSDETQSFLTRLADHAAIAIANAQLYEAVQAANQAKSEFVSLVAHELKNPMTSIRGYTDLLRKGQLGAINEAQLSFLNTILSNVGRMDTLVADLSDMSKIEAGQLRLELGMVSIADAVDEVARSLKGQITAKDQTLRMQIPEDIPPVWADYTRLVQVLTNLVSNAHKYTPEGGDIRVWAERTTIQHDAESLSEGVHVAVQDNGIGIGPEDQEGIFQKFFRSEDEKARQAPGTGLGLNISKNLVELQGGRIWFESELRQGTIFHFVVPVGPAT
jgi:signal transduction histidine kinase